MVIQQLNAFMHSFGLHITLLVLVLMVVLVLVLVLGRSFSPEKFRRSPIDTLLSPLMLLDGNQNSFTVFIDA